LSEQQLVTQVLKYFESSYDNKDSLGLFEDWVTFDDYFFGRVNLPQTREDPGSNTNIILPNIESQVADLVDQPMDTMIKGEEPSDHVFALHVQHLIKWILHKNKMVFNLDRHEHHRLKFGTGVWKVWYDPNALRGRGLPIISSINPVNFFPDPKVTSCEELQEGDFVIHATHKPLNWVKRHPMFRDRAGDLKPAEYFSFRTLTQFEGEGNNELDSIARDKVLYMECWMKDLWDDGTPYVRLVVVANNVLLYDSKEHRKKGGPLSFYKHGKFPFVPIPCYFREGMLWGVGDVELLIPTQDLINDFDDQIRRNARLMGNIQKIIGIASGINPKKWTNQPGLNVIARDPNAWQIVQPPNIPSYIQHRRDTAFREAEIVSGRSDVVEGRRPGSLRAAAAILALQEAGNRRANHKRLMLQTGLQQVIEILIDYIKEYFTEERAFRIIGSKDDDYIWFKGSTLKSIPRLVPKPTINPETGEEEHTLTALYGPEGKNVLTKEAAFDIEVHIGAGLPTNKSFLYQATTELHANGLVTTEEARMFLKEQLNWPVIDPLNPVGNFAGRNVPPEVTEQMNLEHGGNEYGNFGNLEGGLPPEITQELINRLGTLPNVG